MPNTTEMSDRAAVEQLSFDMLKRTGWLAYADTKSKIGQSVELDREKIRAEIVELAQDRQERLVSLFDKGELEYLEGVALPSSVKALLPEEAQEFIEEEFELNGSLYAIYIDDFEGNESEIRSFAATQKGDYHLKSNEELPINTEPTSIKGQAVAFADKAIVKNQQTYRIHTTEDNYGDQEILYIYWVGNNSFDVKKAEDEFNNGPTSLREFYLRNSYGQVNLSTTVVPIVFDSCIIEGLDTVEKISFEEANKLINVSNFRRVVFDVTPLCGSIFRSRGSVGITKKYDDSFYSMSYIGNEWYRRPGLEVSGVVGHEIGHNLGLRHANSFECEKYFSSSRSSEDCEDIEYGEHESIMATTGPGLVEHNDLNGAHKYFAGWLNNTKTVTLGLNTVFSVHDKKNQTQLLLLPIENSPHLPTYSIPFYDKNLSIMYAIEYRKLTEEGKKGIFINLIDTTQRNQNVVRRETYLWGRPTSQQATLEHIGEVFFDRIHGYSFELKQLTEEYATVDIREIQKEEIDPFRSQALSDHSFSQFFPIDLGITYGATLNDAAGVQPSRVTQVAAVDGAAYFGQDTKSHLRYGRYLASAIFIDTLVFDLVQKLDKNWFSVSLWLNISDIPQNSAFVDIISIGNHSYVTISNQSIVFEPTLYPSLNGTVFNPKITAPIEKDKWQHYIWTYVNNYLSVHVNGVFVNTTKIANINEYYFVYPQWNRRNAYTMSFGANPDLDFSADPNVNNRARFIGGIDDVLFFDRGLTRDEIRQLSNSRTTKSSIGSIFKYKSYNPEKNLLRISEPFMKKEYYINISTAQLPAPIRSRTGERQRSNNDFLLVEDYPLAVKITDTNNKYSTLEVDTNTDGVLDLTLTVGELFFSEIPEQAE